ncbi:ester cyclase [Pseudomonas sp. BN415]|uniref:ester cyclase n=1 Tax=Pseudomonas sp. BN415 TaxID=2567889 RepID=UPI002455D498|nr:ester cyclase [Pseudomonas sp. BN415]MDH4581144.1 ester cyclase [Pseudomonas sp. BN415]MDH4582369.1 ester cyclase [Pseudomonas sp. BN415]MDH4582374.1 ester cyclase [Pseudomonas sp. BN415]
MRNTLRSFGFILLSTLACMAHAADDAKAIVDGYMAAWNAHDVDKAASFLAEDAEFFDATVGTPQQGRAAARDNVIKVFITAVPNLTWKMTSEPIVSADGIAFQWEFAGTNSGAWSAETPATHKPLKFEGVSFIRVKDGKIAYQGDYYDALGFNKQLGW